MTTTNPTPALTPASEKLFRSLAEDAVNWSGIPLLGNNMIIDANLKGNVTHLKKLDLIWTETDEGNIWVFFTDKGKGLSREFGYHVVGEPK